MRKQRRQQMNTQATKEEQEERNPPQVPNERRKEILVTKSIFEEGETEIPNTGKDDGTHEEDLNRVQVEFVDMWGKLVEKVVQD